MLIITKYFSLGSKDLWKDYNNILQIVIQHYNILILKDNLKKDNKIIEHRLKILL